MNIFVLFAVVLAAFFIGFSLRSKQIRKNHSRVMQLETEMIHNHAEILELQKEYISMELKLRGVKDPVVAIKNSAREEGEEKLPDVSLRKKLLNKESSPSRAESYQMIYESLANQEAESVAANQY